MMVNKRPKSGSMQKEVSVGVLEARLKRAVRPKDRVWAIVQLAWKLVGNEATHAEQALILFGEAERLAESIHDRRGIASAMRGTGHCQLLLFNYTAALETLECALIIAEETGDAECEILILQDIGSIYRRQSRYDQALTMLKKCAELAELIGNTKVQAFALNQTGLLLRNFGRYQEALESHTKSLELLNNGGTPRNRATTLLSMSYALQYLGKYTDALLALDQARMLCHTGEDLSVEGQCQNAIGMIYCEIGDYPRALSSFIESAKIMERIGDRLNLANVFANQLNVYLQSGNTEQITDLSKKTLILFEELGDKRGQAVICGNLGEYYLERGERTRSRRAINKCLALSKEIGSKDHETSALIALAKLETKHGNYEAARKSLQAALTMAGSSGDRNRTIGVLLGLGELFNKRTQPDQAIPVLERAVALAGEINMPYYEQLAHQQLAEALEARETLSPTTHQENLKRALMHRKLASSIKEKMLSAEKQKAITELQIRSNIEKSEQKTELLRKETRLLRDGNDGASKEIERRTIELIERTELLRTIRLRIRKVLKSRGRGVAGHARAQIDQLLLELDDLCSTKRKRAVFNDEFQRNHQGFIRKLSHDYPTLTVSERKICTLLVEGYSNKQMADILKVTPRTIEVHRCGVRKKMKLGRKANLNIVLARM
jgi:tetratricopeptide (TPR) repeat protein/DNA-binding CsgD family transcriptional regulator